MSNRDTYEVPPEVVTQGAEVIYDLLGPAVGAMEKRIIFNVLQQCYAEGRSVYKEQAERWADKAARLTERNSDLELALRRLVRQ